MRKIGLATLLALAATARAQGPFDGQQVRPLTPQMRQRGAQRAAWQKEHVFRLQLFQTVQTLLDFETHPATKLSASQRARIHGLLSPWRKKPAMTEEQARRIGAALFKLYTREQKERLMLQNMSPMLGSGRFLGIRFQNGVNPQELMDAREFNPLNPATLPTETLQLSLGAEVDRLLRLLGKKK